MLQALPMMVATLAMAGPAPQVSTVIRTPDAPVNCGPPLDDKFVILVPKTPAFGPGGLLRLIQTPRLSASSPDRLQSCGMQRIEQR
jgi:hypothetical protein